MEITYSFIYSLISWPHLQHCPIAKGSKPAGTSILNCNQHALQFQNTACTYKECQQQICNNPVKTKGASGRRGDKPVIASAVIQSLPLTLKNMNLRSVNCTLHLWMFLAQYHQVLNHPPTQLQTKAAVMQRYSYKYIFGYHFMSI